MWHLLCSSSNSLVEALPTLPASSASTFLPLLLSCASIPYFKTTAARHTTHLHRPQGGCSGGVGGGEGVKGVGQGSRFGHSHDKAMVALLRPQF